MIPAASGRCSAHWMIRLRPPRRLKTRKCSGVLVCAVHQVGVALAHGAVVHARHVVVSEPVNVVFPEQVLVQRKEVVCA